MVFSTRIIVGMSCGLVLCLGLSNAMLTIDSFAEDLEAGKHAGRQDLIKKNEVAVKEVLTIKGEVLRVEPDYYLIRDSDADILRLYVDKNTQKTGNIRQGDRIEATVNDQNYTLSIRLAQ